MIGLGYQTASYHASHHRLNHNPRFQPGVVLFHTLPDFLARVLFLALSRC